MTDNRIALHTDSKICNGDKSIQIKEEIGRGANCIVYDAVCTDGIGAEHSVRIKECYPCYLLLDRTAEGMITVYEKEAGKYAKAKEAFIQGYRKNVALRRTLGIVNSTVDASDIFEKNNTVYIVMEMDEGGDYRKYTDHSLKELLRHMKSLAELIMKYHERGYLHLDVKPENIFVLPETAEHILLFDYESVTSLEELQTSGGFQLSFSEGFSAPEQIQGKINKIGKHTDIYSIGAILFFKLFDRKPELEDCKISSIYDFRNMRYSSEKYQPKLYRKLGEFFKKTLSVAAVTRWQEMQSVIDMLEELIRLSDIEEIFLLDSFRYNSAHFVGRNEEMEEIGNILAQHQAVFLSGIGGIGKTELARQYARLCRKQYDTIVFAVFGENIQSLVCDEIGINHMSREEDETEADYFKRKIEVLKKIVTCDDLIIIDNFDVESDDNLEILFSCPCKFIVTTRMDFRDYNYNQIMVDRIDNLKDILDLFYAYNDNFYTEEENEAVIKLIDYVGYHTMTVELIAKYLRNSEESPIDLYGRFLEREGTANTDEIRVKQRKDSKLRSESVNTHLSTLFDVSGFEETEKEIIGSLSLFAGMRIKKLKFSILCAVDGMENKTEHLIKSGWIEYNAFSGKISLHQVIQDMVYKNLKPAAETCPNIVKGMSEYLSADMENYSERKIREKVFDVFMGRLSGNTIPYARLCLQYGKIYQLEQAERICLACGSPEAFDLLQRIYRKKIGIAGECNDIFESELDMDEYLAQQLAVMGEMFDKVSAYCRKSSEKPDYIVKEYIEVGYETAWVVDSGSWWWHSEEPIPALDEICRKIADMIDLAAELIPLTSYPASEKVKLYRRIQNFYHHVDMAAPSFLNDGFYDIEKAYSYQELIDQLNKEISEENETGTDSNSWYDIDVFGGLAEKYQREGKYEEAIEYYQKASEEGKEIYEVAMAVIADIYLENGQPDMAIAYLEKIRESEKKNEENPDTASGYSGYMCIELIRLLIQQKYYEKAEIYAKELIHYKNPDALKENDENSVTEVLAAYFFLYIIQENSAEKERLWQECLTYYEMLGNREIREDIFDFITEYLTRETVSGKMILEVLNRIGSLQTKDMKKKIIQQSIGKYAGEKNFNKYHVILLLKLAELATEDSYEDKDVKSGLQICDQAKEYYIQYGMEDEYILSLLNSAKAEIMSHAADYEYEELQEIRRKCDYRLLAEQKIINGKFREEEQIDIWIHAADQYGYIDNYAMKAVCLNLALEVGVPIVEQGGRGIVIRSWNYWNIMEKLINTYIALKAFEPASAAIHEMYDKIIEYLKETKNSGNISERVYKVKSIADFYVKISRNTDAVRMYLTAMYVALGKEPEEDILTGQSMAEKSIIYLCEVINGLLDKEVESNIVDFLVGLKDELITYRDDCPDGCEGYDAIITKISDRYQYQEIEFKRQ